MPTLIVLIGPTGVGKTELSLRLAETFQTSIVSADSRQLYAELKIGTAAPTPDQLKRVPHQLGRHAPPHRLLQRCPIRNRSTGNSGEIIHATRSRDSHWWLNDVCRRYL